MGSGTTESIDITWNAGVLHSSLVWIQMNKIKVQNSKSNMEDFSKTWIESNKKKNKKWYLVLF